MRSLKLEIEDTAIKQLVKKFKLIRKSVGIDIDSKVFCNSAMLGKLKFLMVRHARLGLIIDILNGKEKKTDYTKSYIKEINNTAKLELKYYTENIPACF